MLGLATALARTPADVDLFATVAGEGWKSCQGTLRIEVFRRDWPLRICPSAGLKRRLADEKASVIHHHSLWLRTLRYAHQSAMRGRVPLVLSPRGMMDPWAWRHHSWRKAIARALLHPGALEDVSGWHATGEDEARSIRELGFRQPICVAPNGVAALSDAEAVNAAEHWRRLVPSASDRPVALFYSRFHQKKRLIELLDLWLEHAPKDWLLLVVGIPEEYTPSSVEAYVMRAGHSGRVRAFDGTSHPPPYPIANLFLLPSHGENFGQSIAEALANGVPALVTDTTPWSGLSSAGAGWCVPWDQYAKALKSATAEGAEALRQRGAGGREWVLREYSWTRTAGILSEFYSSLTANPKGRGHG